MTLSLRQGWTGARLALGLALCAAGAIPGGTGDARAQPVASVQIAEAWCEVPGQPGRTVPLPDWLPPVAAPAPPDSLVEAVYRIEVDLGPAPVEAAVYLPGVFGHLRLAVNGRAILDGTREPLAPSPRGIGRLRLVEIPATQLQPGRNRIDITLKGRGRISLSPVWVGPPKALHEMRDRKAFGLVYGPGLVAAIIGCLGLSVLLLYLRRPKDTLYGYFGVAALAWGLHTLWSVLPTQLLPAHHNYLWWSVLYTFVVAALANFALRFAGYHWPRVERSLWAASASTPLVYYAARALGWFAPVEQAWRLGLVGVAFGGLVAVAVSGWRKRSTDSALLVAAGLAAASLGLADWLAAYRRQDNLPVTLVPWAGLAFVVLVTWFLIDRFVRATEALEAMNRELEMRVERKRVELVDALDSMRAARDAAEAANRAKSRFLAAASHDLRQPMHALGLYMAALRYQPMSDAQHELTARMAGSVSALESMFDSLLDISRMDAGVIIAEPAPFEIDALVRRLVGEFAPEAEAKGLRLSVRVAPAARRWRARTDPLLLERVLRNLIANALKYTQLGGVLVSCRLRGDAIRPVWRIEVWDTGTGIPLHEQARVFDEFYQLGNPSRERHAGLGLGLSVVRRLTDLLGLPLQLRSRPGHGSRFRVDLPATDEPAPAPDDTAPPGSVAGLGVAVIEDDPEVRDSMQRLLSGWGCRVAVGADASEVEQQALAQDIRLDLIVADLRLRDGREGLSEIDALRRACGRPLPALLVSGDSAPERVALMQRSGLPWLAKPVSAARLRSWLVAALPRSTEPRT